MTMRADSIEVFLFFLPTEISGQLFLENLPEAILVSQLKIHFNSKVRVSNRSILCSWTNFLTTKKNSAGHSI